MTKTRAIAIISSVVLLSTGQALALAESPMVTIRKTNSTLHSLLKKEGEGKPSRKVKQVVNGFIDFEELARRSLGKHWEKRTPAERAEFVEILAELIERNYVKQLRGNLGYKLEYRDQKVDGDKAHVVTVVKVTKDGRTEEVTVEYKMRKTKRGWMAYDVITDDVSVVRNYRSQFNRIITRDSYEELVKKMRRKLEKI